VSASQLYAEDLQVGFTFEGEFQHLTAEMFTTFASLTGDRHPIHYDESYAAKTDFGRPAAHGLLLGALTAVGATTTSPRLTDSMVALISQRTDFLKPAFVGDRLQASYTVVTNSENVRRTKARVEVKIAVVNQDGDAVLSGAHVYLLRCRPS
jgi:3-hydroxybutyryl-CoA dehydratase